MQKFLAAFVILLLLGGPAAAWPHPDNSEAPDDNGSLPNAWSLQDRERAALRRVYDRLQKGDVNYAVIAQHLRVILEDTAFVTLTPAEQHYTLLVYGGALFNSRQFALAQAPLARASAMAEASATDWEFRLRNAIALQDYPDAARAATSLAQHWPDRIAHFDDRVFATILTETQKDPATAGLAADLQAALAAANRHPAGGS